MKVTVSLMTESHRDGVMKVTVSRCHESYGVMKITVSCSVTSES
jgi:hypothetical protein